MPTPVRLMMRMDTSTLGAPPSSSFTRVVSMVAFPDIAAPPAMPVIGITIELAGAASAAPPTRRAAPIARATSETYERFSDNPIRFIEFLWRPTERV